MEHMIITKHSEKGIGCPVCKKVFYVLFKGEDGVFKCYDDYLKEVHDGLPEMQRDEEIQTTVGSSV